MLCAVLCAADYIPVLLDDRRFMIFNSPLNYVQAYDACKAANAMLATLRNQDETNKLLAKLPAATYALWMGLSNTLPPTEGSITPRTPTPDKAKWYWLSDEKPPEWDHWAINENIPSAVNDPEPNNWNGQEGACAAVYGNRETNNGRLDGTWNDL
jgi:hypothetical protein